MRSIKNTAFIKPLHQSRKNLNEVATCLLILLFVYAAVSKLVDYEQARQQMMNQVFPASLSEVFTWAVPMLELITALLMAFPVSKIAGLWFSVSLLFGFTGYIALVLLHIFNRVPCSCGGVLVHMGWRTHLIFNMFFLALNIIAIKFTLEERRHVGKGT